jgi:hypothetical protein
MRSKEAVRQDFVVMIFLFMLFGALFWPSYAAMLVIAPEAYRRYRRRLAGAR